MATSIVRFHIISNILAVAVAAATRAGISLPRIKTIRGAVSWLGVARTGILARNRCISGDQKIREEVRESFTTSVLEGWTFLVWNLDRGDLLFQRLVIDLGFLAPRGGALLGFREIGAGLTRFHGTAIEFRIQIGFRTRTFFLGDSIYWANRFLYPWCFGVVSLAFIGANYLRTKGFATSGSIASCVFPIGKIRRKFGQGDATCCFFILHLTGNQGAFLVRELTRITAFYVARGVCATSTHAFCFALAKVGLLARATALRTFSTRIIMKAGTPPEGSQRFCTLTCERDEFNSKQYKQDE